MFQKILIANRGAIATRIVRTLKTMNITSVAVYTYADQDSLHVDAADEAIRIGEGPAHSSYLNGDLLIEMALSVGAEAIHPGYGFLSENAEFARKCQEHGIVFVGPSPEHIALFGHKHSARVMAIEAGLPVLAASSLLETEEDALCAAQTVGYPVMVKATAGGGGIGMQVCADESELVTALHTVKHLAGSHFNDSGAFLEKYIQNARHIEVQIFGNHLGEAVALGERDCSLQRRHQKVVEETPAPNLPNDVRQKMLTISEQWARAMGYRNAGTIEFIYDADRAQFYFLEVNTRLQVEHGVTEEVLGIDLVEWMVREAAGEIFDMRERMGEARGHSMQARIYAEDAFHQFRPHAGLVDRVMLAKSARVETWLRDGVEVSPLYDPMLAKIIVHAPTRREAIQKLKDALEDTRFYGITTNRDYLVALCDELARHDTPLTTMFLPNFSPSQSSLEVLDPGVQSTMQDWPGRQGYWHVGVPPSGAMDGLAFRLGNRILGNDEGACGLEQTLRGGTFQFRGPAVFCITGADMQATLDGTHVPRYQVITARAGQVLQFGEAQTGLRSYLLLAGGFDYPKTLGSASTFTLGRFGGHGGRALQRGDTLSYHGSHASREIRSLMVEEHPHIGHEWTLRVMAGPHSTTEFLQPAYLTTLTENSFTVHFNSSRTGVRLIGPAPPWAREDGGDAGLHPSNIHDNAYAIGALDLTGDMPILLGPDGPSLGGFVCPVTVVKADLWKMGQLKPGDTVHFRLITLSEATMLYERQEAFIAQLSKSFEPLSHTKDLMPKDNPILYVARHEAIPMIMRASGDENILVEFGAMELDVRYRFAAHALMQAIQNSRQIPFIDLTPGIRTLQVHIDRTRISMKAAVQKIADIHRQLPALDSIKVASRIVRLPLSFDDPATQLAIDRYQQNVRPDAPWCPSNLEFIRRINGLTDIEDVRHVIFDATYLVMGLGDVYLGAPVAVPLDPRHRLVTTKYNPARTWTPENAVGIGGAYLCVYGMEGPGGYQFVGRTVQMWNRFRQTPNFQSGVPWLLRFFDQIQFYPVSSEELLQLREDFVRGRFTVDIWPTTFDLGEYLQFLNDISDDAEEFRRRQQSAFADERQRWREAGVSEYVADEAAPPEDGDKENLPLNSAAVRSAMPGSVWKILVSSEQTVKKGETLVVVESMKMEFTIKAPADGVITAISVAPGEQVRSGQLLMAVQPESN